MGWGGGRPDAAGNATTRQATRQATPPRGRQRGRQHRNAAGNAAGNAATIKKGAASGRATKWGGAAFGRAPPFCISFFIFAALSVALPVALPVVWWRCLLRCLPRGGVACRVAESVVALPAKAGRPPTPPQQVSQVVPSLFPKFRLFKLRNAHFCKKHKNRANLASGPRKSDSTRREAFNAPNESSVAALGASLVTKQAGRVPQHD